MCISSAGIAVELGQITGAFNMMPTTATIGRELTVSG